MMGFNNFDSFSNKVVDFTISINPFHKQIVPKNVIDNSTALETDSNIKGFTAKAIHPKLKGNLMGCKFKPSNSDKEIFIYNIK